ncbi:hypothetical protein [Hymenobacter metallicola]|uniref:Uncharacterized protein n=1 Tax=Hymenobacter metallicola TaxID=2563114 RepID=A0A4Z0QJ56_9BACT|nr:hypothetical protein [Hymenobacter metallicola]TGE29814.1 hypothetical protein E5K02_10245 [Hymenobacter metallicola]
MTQLFQVPQAVYNNFSQDLLDSLPKDINPNQKVIFRAIQKGSPMQEIESSMYGTSKRNVTKNWSNLPLVENILDPGTSQYVGLAYFGGPVTPTAKPLLVEFKRASMAQVEVVPNRQPDLYHRLMFSNYNKNCCNPAHSQPADGYMFEVIRPEKTAADLFKRKKNVAIANEAIILADVTQLVRLAPKVGVSVPAYITERLEAGTLKEDDDSELRNNYMALAESDPETLIKRFEADEERLFKLVDNAVKHEVIAYDRQQAQWVLLPERKFLCIVLPGQKVEDAMADFLILPNHEPIKKAIEKAVAQREKNK